MMNEQRIRKEQIKGKERATPSSLILRNKNPKDNRSFPRIKLVLQSPFNKTFFV